MHTLDEYPDGMIIKKRMTRQEAQQYDEKKRRDREYMQSDEYKQAMAHIRDLLIENFKKEFGK